MKHPVLKLASLVLPLSLSQCTLFSGDKTEEQKATAANTNKPTEEISTNPQEKAQVVSLPPVTQPVVPAALAGAGAPPAGVQQHRAPRPEGMMEPEVTTALPLNIDGSREKSANPAQQ